SHSPSMLVIHNKIAKKKKSFRFANYVADKTDFLDIAKDVWDMKVFYDIDPKKNGGGDGGEMVEGDVE
ncbi:hypothetical protein Tco_0394876, partial [Tanacetum coccineum]